MYRRSAAIGRHGYRLRREVMSRMGYEMQHAQPDTILFVQSLTPRHHCEKVSLPVRFARGYNSDMENIARMYGWAR
jgi:hypothetical protein